MRCHLIPYVVGQLEHKKCSEVELRNSEKWSFPMAASPVHLVLSLKPSFSPLSFKVCFEMHDKIFCSAGSMLMRLNNLYFAEQGHVNQIGLCIPQFPSFESLATKIGGRFLQETRNALCWWRRNKILECVIFFPLYRKSFLEQKQN